MGAKGTRVHQWLKTCDGGVRQPVEPSARIQEIDILRGFALLGVLLVNFYSMSSARSSASAFDSIHRITDRFIEVALNGRFYPLFALLFGFGIALQLFRAGTASQETGRFMARRMLALLLLGCLHFCFLWEGDVLHLYALVGLLILPCREANPRRFLWGAGLVLGFGLILPPVLNFLKQQPGQPVLTASVQPSQTEVEEGGKYSAIRSYRELAGLRAKVLFTRLVPEELAKASTWILLGMVLLGFYVGRSFLPVWTESDSSSLRRWVWGSLVVSGLCLLWIPCWRWASAAIWNGTHEPLPARLLGGTTLRGILGRSAGPAMALFYASSVMSLLRLPRWLGRLSLLGTIGRLSLSNYLLVSLLGTTVFYSYALGFRGKMSPGQVLIFGILAYAGLGAFSRWWSGHYRLGPMEWVWRRLSYGSPAAMGSR